jgi:hypothetical protein
MGSESKVSIFGRFVGDEEVAFPEPCHGALSSSAFMVSDPKRLIDWTSLSSRTVPFGLIFFGFEETDMVGTCQKSGWRILVAINQDYSIWLKQSNNL